MNGWLPPALLVAATGLAVAFAARRAGLVALAALVMVAGAAHVARPSARSSETVLLGVWASVAATALLVHWPRGVPGAVAVAAGANAGLWAGAATADARDLVPALACGLVALPSAWAARRGAGVAVKVVASWMVAVALLAALLPLASTPGYVPDHMD